MSANVTQILPQEDLGESLRPEHHFLSLILLGIGLLGLALLKSVPSLDVIVLQNNVAHVAVVGGAAALGIVQALLTLRAAYQANDGRVFLIGLGFLTTACILLIHAVATPHVLMEGRTTAASRSTQLSLVLGGLLFALSALPISPELNTRLMRHARACMVLLCIGLVSYGVIFLVLVPAYEQSSAMTMTMPMGGESYGSTSSVAPSTAPKSVDTLTLLITLLGLACYVFAVWRYFVMHRQRPSLAGWSIMCGIALFGESLLSNTFWTPYAVTFWLSHAQEFIGFGVIAFAVLGERWRGQTNTGLLESVFLGGTRARLQSRYGAAMDELTALLARGDQLSPALRQMLLHEFGLSATQLQVFERTAKLVTAERHQRQQLERLNAALHEVEQAKTQLTHMIVHDMKTPLTGLLGFLSLLNLTDLSPLQREMLERATRSSKNLSGLIGDLLDMARIEEGHLELDRSLFAPADLLHSCVAELHAWFDQMDKVVKIEVPEQSPGVCADYRILQRVLFNLLSNAIKHTPSGTTITLRGLVETAADQEGVSQFILEVADNGPGIAPDVLERVFEPFARGRGVSYAQQINTGLGLTFCKLATEAHHGTIMVTSSLGVGTTFRVTIPLDADLV